MSCAQLGARVAGPKPAGHMDMGNYSLIASIGFVCVSASALAQSAAPPQIETWSPPPSYVAPEGAPENLPDSVAPREAPRVQMASPRAIGQVLHNGQVLLWDDQHGEYVLKRIGEETATGRLLGIGDNLLVVETQNGQLLQSLRAPLGLRSGKIVHLAAPMQPPEPTPASAPSPPIATPSRTATIATQFTPAAAAASSNPQYQGAAAPILVPRSEFDRQLSDFVSLGDQVNIGQAPTGNFRLVGVRPGSFVERIGLRPGDVLVSVDGRAVRNAEDAASAYAWLRTTDKFRVDILRDGRPQTLAYQLVPGSVAQAP